MRLTPDERATLLNAIATLQEMATRKRGYMVDAVSQDASDTLATEANALDVMARDLMRLTSDRC